jgi:hypothetical protein
MSAVNHSTILIPPRPDLVIRVAFAGNIVLPSDAAPLRARALDAVLELLARELITLPASPTQLSSAQCLTDYYASGSPLLRLITGLAEGSDVEATAALQRLTKSQDLTIPLHAAEVRTELAAVLGCNVADYRNSRPAAHQPVFDKLLQECAYVLALDGVYQAGPTGSSERKRLYRAQSTFLLRQADLLIAVADPQKVGEAGGTLETLRNSLLFGLPVVFIHSGTGHIHYFAPGTDPTPELEAFADSLEESAIANWHQPLAAWVRGTVDNLPYSEVVNGTASEYSLKEENQLLKEYFTTANVPLYNKLHTAEELPVRRASWLERRWQKFEGPFKLATSTTRQDRQLMTAYDLYRNRAADLSAHYAGRFRGTFITNYGLAILVAILVACSIIVLDYQVTHPGAEYPLVAALLEAGKLLIISVIFYHSYTANKNYWNDRAIDYRYLSERLMALRVLPVLGSFQPPSAGALHFASRVSRQSAVEWLFKAITRSIPPLPPDTPLTEIPVTPDTTLRVRLLTCNTQEGINKIKWWLDREVGYHAKNQHTMHGINSFLKRTVEVMGILSLAAVVANVVLLLTMVDWSSHLSGADKAHEAVHHEYLIPLLLLLTVVLPIIVVGLSGIRLQSEAHRLAERSVFLRRLLTKRQRELNELDQRLISGKKLLTLPNAAVLDMGEKIAADHVQEVTEWSVVYAKELLES